MSDTPPGWVVSTLGEACEVVQGQSPPGTSYNTDGIGLPFFQGKAEFGDMFPSVRKWTTDPRKIAEDEDILLSIRAPVGPTNLAPERCVIGRGLAAVRPRGGIPARFVLYWLRSTADMLAAGATGSTFDAVSGSRVRGHPLLLPPLNEQQRIVAAIEGHLSRLDVAESILHQARLRLNGLRHVTIAAATGGEWPVVPLREVTESQIYGSGSRATSDARGVPMLAMGNIQDGRLVFTNLKYLDESHPDVAKYTLLRGDLLFNRTNSPELVGKAAVFKGGLRRAIFASYLIRARLGPECDPDWAALVINGPIGRRYVASVRTQQVGQANVNGTKLASFPLPLPSLDEQRRIVTRVEEQLSATDGLRAAIDHAQHRSASLRRAVLERAFCGELVPQDPSDEPAPVLLERIRAERAATASLLRRRTVSA